MRSFFSFRSVFLATGKGCCSKLPSVELTRVLAIQKHVTSSQAQLVTGPVGHRPTSSQAQLVTGPGSPHTHIHAHTHTHTHTQTHVQVLCCYLGLWRSGPVEVGLWPTGPVTNWAVPLPFNFSSWTRMVENNLMRQLVSSGSCSLMPKCAIFGTLTKADQDVKQLKL